MLFCLIVEMTLRQRIVCQKSLHVSISTSWTFHFTPSSLGEKCPYSEFFWSVFSRIRTGHGEIRSISPYSVRIRETMDQKNSKYGHFTEWRSEFEIQQKLMVVYRLAKIYINFWDKIVMSWEFLTSPDFITNLYWPKPFTY